MGVSKNHPRAIRVSSHYRLVSCLWPSVRANNPDRDEAEDAVALSGFSKLGYVEVISEENIDPLQFETKGYRAARILADEEHDPDMIGQKFVKGCAPSADDIEALVIEEEEASVPISGSFADIWEQILEDEAIEGGVEVLRRYGYLGDPKPGIRTIPATDLKQARAGWAPAVMAFEFVPKIVRDKATGKKKEVRVKKPVIDTKTKKQAVVRYAEVIVRKVRKLLQDGESLAQHRVRTGTLHLKAA